MNFGFRDRANAVRLGIAAVTAEMTVYGVNIARITVLLTAQAAVTIRIVNIAVLAERSARADKAQFCHRVPDLTVVGDATSVLLAARTAMMITVILLAVVGV